MQIRDGIWDYMSETTFSTMGSSLESSIYSARVTFMEGVTEVDFTGATAVATNGQTTVNPEGPITVSRNAMVFYDESTVDFDWMRKVEVLHDPLHLNADYSYDFTLDAEDFEAPKGVCSTEARVRFTGCAFKVFPKMYSDEVMAELPVWPPNPYTYYLETDDLFYRTDCPNVEKVAQQGQLGDDLKVLYLLPDFLYMSNGRYMFDAFPTGGAPEMIVSAMLKITVGWEDTLPAWDMSKLKIFQGVLDDIEIVAKKGTTPSIPLLGLDFASAPELEHIDLGFNLTIEEDYEKDIVVTTGSLGIMLPDAVKYAPGAWRMWQHSTEAGKETHVATPDGLRALELDGWADALEDYAGDKLTKDAMPPTPSGIVDARGYYMKYVTNFDHHPVWVKEEGPQDRMAHDVSLAAKIMIDGVQSQITIQPLPPTVERADFYAAGTYQHSEVVTDITVPAIPSSAINVDGAYMRTFYQAVGEEVKSDEVEFPQMVLTSMSHDKKGMLYECTKPEDVSLNEAYDAIYWSYADEKGDTVEDNKVHLPWPEIGHAYNYRGGYSETTVEYSYSQFRNATGDDSRNENYTGLGLIYVIRDWMKNTVVKGRYVTAEITNSIVLEREPLPNVTSAIDFQLETFYGSGVMPNRVDCLIPVQGAMPFGRSYQSAINVKPVRESTIMPDAVYTHDLAYGAYPVNPDEDEIDENSVSLLRYHTALLRPELQKYTFNSDELIIAPGVRGADASFIGLLPATTRFTSPRSQFASIHGIELGSGGTGMVYQDESLISGIFTSNPRWTLMSDTALWSVIGAVDPIHIPNGYYINQRFSYSDEPVSETGLVFQAPTTDRIPYDDTKNTLFGDFNVSDAYAIYLHTQDGQKNYDEANGG